MSLLLQDPALRELSGVDVLDGEIKELASVKPPVPGAGRPCPKAVTIGSGELPRLPEVASSQKGKGYGKGIPYTQAVPVAKKTRKFGIF